MRRKQDRGKALTELVKGSYDYLLTKIRMAFYREFDDEGDLWIAEIFADFLIVNTYKLPPDEFYYVPFSLNPDGSYAFTPREQWEVVELAYQLTAPISTADSRPRADAPAPFVEGARRRVDLTEAVQLTRLAEADGATGARRIVGYGVTADAVNGNRRVYPRPVLDAALAEARSRIATLGGRAVLGEAEHPGDKPTPRANFLETVVRWDVLEIEGDGRARVEGLLIPTSKGQDAITLMEHGVMPGLSQRAWGYAELATIDGVRVERITELHIDGYDLVLDPADPNGAVTMLESRRAPAAPATTPNRRMPVEDDKVLDLAALRQQYPHLVAQIESERDATQRKALEDSLRLASEQQRAINEAVAAARAETQAEEAKKREAVERELAESRAEREKLAAAELRRQVNDHIVTKVGELKGLSEAVRRSLIEDVQADSPADAAAADAIIARRAKLVGAGLAQDSLEAQGFTPSGGTGAGRVRDVAPVLERATGQPEFARPALQLQEALLQRGLVQPRNLRQPETPGERLAARCLARFDSLYHHQLVAEARLFAEAETTADLNIPYAVSRAVIAEAVPMLVAASVFDVDTTDQSPTRVYYEQFAYETGGQPTVTDEAVTAVLNGWAALANKRINVGTVVVTNAAGSTTYVEGTDYLVDYDDGRIMAIATITNGQSLLVDYTYQAIRKGEGVAIERGKVQLNYVTLDTKADRLAAQITREAVVFSRSQIGWDATTRTINALIERVARKIDGDLFLAALRNVLQVANNTGGTWTASGGDLADLTAKLGVARVKVANRFYQPTAIVMSLTNADRAANPSVNGNAIYFTAAGARPESDITAEGYVGRMKGLPVFATTNFRDDYILVVNREIVHHRVFQPMMIKGPYPSYSSDGELIASDQYYVEEFNGNVTPLKEKGSYVKVA